MVSGFGGSFGAGVDLIHLAPVWGASGRPLRCKGGWVGKGNQQHHCCGDSHVLSLVDATALRVEMAGLPRGNRKLNKRAV